MRLRSFRFISHGGQGVLTRRGVSLCAEAPDDGMARKRNLSYFPFILKSPIAVIATKKLASSRSAPIAILSFMSLEAVHRRRHRRGSPLAASTISRRVSSRCAAASALLIADDACAAHSSRAGEGMLRASGAGDLFSCAEKQASSRRGGVSI